MSDFPPEETPVEPSVPNPEFPPFGEDLNDADGNPIVKWYFNLRKRVEYLPDGTTVERDFREDEIALIEAKTEAANLQVSMEALLSKAANALDVNRAWLGRTTAPTNAQSLAQIDRLTRQMNALIMLVRQDFSNTTGT
jgi:hypothetical protein